MKIFTLFLLFIIILFGAYSLLDYYGFFGKEVFTAKVIKLEGSNILYLSNNREILLAGVRLPEKSEINYDSVLTSSFRKYIEGKTLKFKVILKKSNDYPLYDTVLGYLPNNKLINDVIIKKGMAFFDHGWYPGKQRFERQENYARKNKKGLWKNIEKYKILFVSAKRFWNYHLVDCPEAQKIKPNERINYYFQPPVIFFFRGPASCVLKKWETKGKDRR